MIYGSSEGIFSQAVSDMMQQAVNKMAQSMQYSYNAWERCKYIREEVEMAIGKEINFRINNNMIIYSVDEFGVMIKEGEFIFYNSPNHIISIPFIDDLRKKKLYKVLS